MPTLSRDEVCSENTLSEIIEVHFADNPSYQIDISTPDAPVVRIVGKVVRPTGIQYGLRTVFLIEEMANVTGCKKIRSEALGAFSEAVQKLVVKNTIFYTEPWPLSGKTMMGWSVLPR